MLHQPIENHGLRNFRRGQISPPAPSSRFSDGLIGFGEFSFWWIQFASVLRCTRSSFPMLWDMWASLMLFFCILWCLTLFPQAVIYRHR